MKSLVLCLVLAGFPAVLLAQPNCTQLGFGDIQPSDGKGPVYCDRWLHVFSLFLGQNLPRCANAAQQCCVTDYIERVQENVRDKLQAFLAGEFEEVVEIYLDDIENLLDCKLLPIWL